MSLAIFVSAAASGLQRAVREHAAPRARERRELVRRPAERQAGLGGEHRAHAARESGCVFRPVPTAVPPIASSYRPGSAASQRRQRLLELRHVAGELLAQRERRGVLQVRAADLHDAPRTRRSSPPACRAAPQQPAAASRAARARRRRAWRSGRRRSTTARGSRRRSDAPGASAPRSPPSSSDARLASTSLTFMLVCVPEPVCQTDQRELVVVPRRRAPRRRRARWRRPCCVSSRPSSALTAAAACLTSASAWITASGMRSPEMRKKRRLRSVCAPHRRSAGTSIVAEGVLLDARAAHRGANVTFWSCSAPASAACRSPRAPWPCRATWPG